MRPFKQFCKVIVDVKLLVGVCSGSTIVGVGDSQPPQFIYDEDKYIDVFVSGWHLASPHNLLKCANNLHFKLHEWSKGLITVSSVKSHGCVLRYSLFFDGSRISATCVLS